LFKKNILKQTIATVRPEGNQQAHRRCLTGMELLSAVKCRTFPFILAAEAGVVIALEPSLGHWLWAVDIAMAPVVGTS
jgi:hypothetical protein